MEGEYSVALPTIADSHQIPKRNRSNAAKISLTHLSLVNTSSGASEDCVPEGLCVFSMNVFSSYASRLTHERLDQCANSHSVEQRKRSQISHPLCFRYLRTLSFCDRRLVPAQSLHLDVWLQQLTNYPLSIEKSRADLIALELISSAGPDRMIIAAV